MQFDDKFLGAGGFENVTVCDDVLSGADGGSANPHSSKAKGKTSQADTLYKNKQLASSSEDIIGESVGSPLPQPVTSVDYAPRDFNKTMPKQKREELNR